MAGKDQRVYRDCLNGKRYFILQIDYYKLLGIVKLIYKTVRIRGGECSMVCHYKSAYINRTVYCSRICGKMPSFGIGRGPCSYANTHP
jgi:hypothetical protein